jgi:hypothetical protein
LINTIKAAVMRGILLGIDGWLPVTTPFEDGLGEHVYHQYSVVDRRDEVMKALQDKQIGWP